MITLEEFNAEVTGCFPGWEIGPSVTINKGFSISKKVFNRGLTATITYYEYETPEGSVDKDWIVEMNAGHNFTSVGFPLDRVLLNAVALVRRNIETTLSILTQTADSCLPAFQAETK